MIHNRETLIEELNKLAEIAKSLNELPASMILYTICGALTSGDERELIKSCAEFSKRQVEKFNGMKARDN